MMTFMMRKTMVMTMIVVVVVVVVVVVIRTMRVKMMTVIITGSHTRAEVFKSATASVLSEI